MQIQYFTDGKGYALIYRLDADDGPTYRFARYIDGKIVETVYQTYNDALASVYLLPGDWRKVLPVTSD